MSKEIFAIISLNKKTSRAGGGLADDIEALLSFDGMDNDGMRKALNDMLETYRNQVKDARLDYVKVEEND